MKPADALLHAGANTPALHQALPPVLPNTSPWRQRLAVSAVLAFVAGLFYLGTKPVAVGLFDAPWDKVVHASLFAIIAMLLAITKDTLSPRWLLACVAIAAGIGALDELHQMYLPGRSADWEDFFADLGGATTGACLVAVLSCFPQTGLKGKLF